MVAGSGGIESTVARSCDVPESDDWLSDTEAAHLATLRVPKRRADWRLGRWTAKQAVRTYLNRPAPLHAIGVVASACGAPEVWIRGQPAPVAISLSHSGDHGFCVVAPAGTEVGCDVETVAPRSAVFAVDYFTAGEQIRIAEARVADRDLCMTLLWSAKESVLKALRCGLRADTRDVGVTLHSDRFSARHISGREFYGWWRATGNLVWTAVPV
jgi:4'-phosphopantetheinyl transferase